ncbi:MAG: cation:proton antiporter [Erysipelotrichaceae bacterium]
MLLSLALIFLCGMVLGAIFEKLKLPNLLGMLISGIILGPYCLNLLDPKILSISPELRQIALIIILTRAGLNLDIKDLKKVGRPAILLCFVPALFEILGAIILGPLLLNLSILDSAILGTVIAAVSPAVIVPKMLKLIKEGYGTNKSIPQMIMAGASVDDVIVIVLFTSLTNLAQSNTLNLTQFITIPSSIILGIIVGVIIGLLLTKLFTKIHMRDSSKIVIILSISFLLVTLEQQLSSIMGFSALLAIMTIGITIQQKKQELSKRLSNKFSKLWVSAQVWLFVLVGATVNIAYATKTGITALILIILLLLFRSVGVLICLLKTLLNTKEKTFCTFAYSPKATVQAAIGGIPLALNLTCGDTILSVAVLSILITAPLGATLIENNYKKLLTKKNSL